MLEPIPFEIRVGAIRAAQGREPFDLLLRGARIADLATMEIREADIGIVGPMIASVHAPGAFTEAKAVQALAGLIVTPGFIDGHVHVESSHMLPHHYASVVVPQGTTAIFWDPHELANVLGLDGIRYAVEATRGLPLRFIVQASSCVPAAPGLEISGADFKAEEIRELMSWPDVAGLAEVMDMRAVLETQPRMMGILEAANASGKIIEGHARELTGPGLMAYLSAGISADHEIGSGADALEKLRAGFTVEIRGSHDHVLPGVVEALNTLPVIPTSLTICTDDVFPDYLVEHGGINDVLRRLIRYGMDPLQAIRCATINNAIRLRREDLGLVAAGRRADLVALSDLKRVTVEAVWSDGRLVAQGGKMIVPLPRAEPPLQNTMKVERLTADDFRIRVPGVTNGRALIQTIKGARFNSWSEAEVEVRDGFVVVPENLSVMAIVHRHGCNDPKPALAVIEGWDRWGGAFATSYSHDSHNLILYGHDAAELALAANTVIGMQGGIVVVRGGKVVAQLAYPVAGMLSLDDPSEVALAHRRIVEAAGEICAWQPPYRTFKALSGQSLACNPGPHLTDLGLTDGTTKEIRPGLIRMV